MCYAYGIYNIERFTFYEITYMSSYNLQECFNFGVNTFADKLEIGWKKRYRRLSNLQVPKSTGFDGKLKATWKSLVFVKSVYQVQNISRIFKFFSIHS